MKRVHKTQMTALLAMSLVSYSVQVGFAEEFALRTSQPVGTIVTGSIGSSRMRTTMQTYRSATDEKNSLSDNFSALRESIRLEDGPVSYLLMGQSLKPTIHSSPAYNSSLSGFLNAAIINNNELRASLHDVETSRHQIMTAKLQLLPTLDLTATEGTGREYSFASSSLIERRDRAIALNLDWTIYSSGANRSRIEAAKYASRAVTMRYLAIERQAVLENLGVYLQLLSQQKLLASLKRTRGRMHHIRNSVRKRFQAGFASRTEVAQVDVELSNINIQIEQAQLVIRQQSDIWKTRVGTAPSSSISTPKVAHLVPDNVETAIHKALKDNPEVLSSQYASLSAEAESEAALAATKPRVSIYGSYEMDLDKASSAYKEEEWTAGVRLTVPLINFAATSQYQESREQVFAASYRADDTQKRIEEEIRVNWHDYRTRRNLAKVLSRRTNAARRIVTGVSKEVRAGLRPLDDLIREEIQLARSEVERVNNEIQMFASAYRVAIHFNGLPLSAFTSH